MPAAQPGTSKTGIYYAFGGYVRAFYGPFADWRELLRRFYRAEMLGRLTEPPGVNAAPTRPGCRPPCPARAGWPHLTEESPLTLAGVGECTDPGAEFR